ncbi:uracil-DNA glycosylase family protein [Sedimentitalea sp. HM32M-2]|uniref:uracil-DNA glycosylase family protein n=1 Tax=Sedimentitalea sp. HM32M-2 TaxID=3351566 RepID=UPI003627AC8F
MRTEKTDLELEIAGCDLCRARFAATATAHRPRPVVWFRHATPILIAGQAPGMRVHDSGRPFSDRSGDRLRQWMGVDEGVFYDRRIVSILPTSFCFPGYSAKGADLPPPPICWDTWHARCLAQIGPSRLRLIVGGHAMRRHLGHRGSVTEAVKAWRDHAPQTFVLPHPSWRNTAWLRANPWFQREVLPALQQAVQRVRDTAD